MRHVDLSNAIKNDEWIDAVDGEVSLDELPEIPGYHVLVRPFSVKEKTKSGIFIPDSIKDDIAYLTTVGQVIVVGDLAYEDKTKFPKGPWCTVGDHVCYGKHTGQNYLGLAIDKKGQLRSNWMMDIKEAERAFNRYLEDPSFTKRRNRIIQLLCDWGLITVLNADKITDIAPLNQIKVLAYKEKNDWILETKYNIGKKKKVEET